MRGLRHVPLLAVLLAATAVAAPPADTPDVLLPPAPATPAPMPAPGQTVKLAKGQYYVLRAAHPQYLKARGAGKVAIKTRDGSKAPLKLPAASVIGWPADPVAPAPKPEPVDPDFPPPVVPTPAPVVTFAEPFLYVVQAAATGQVELEIVPRLNRLVDGKPVPLSDADVVSVAIDVDAGQGPQPPPAPVDPPKPAPGAGTGAWAVVVVDDLTPDPAAAKVIDGPTFRSLKAAGRCRVYGAKGDADVVAAKNYGPLVAKAGGTPALLVLDKKGDAVWVGRLPADEAAAAAKLKEVMTP